MKNAHDVLKAAIQKLRKPMREMRPCKDCGTAWCEEMVDALAETENLVEDLPLDEELDALAQAS